MSGLAAAIWVQRRSTAPTHPSAVQKGINIGWTPPVNATVHPFFVSF
jgi:hypothetical protein